MNEFVNVLPPDSKPRVFYENLLKLSFADLKSLKDHYEYQRTIVDTAYRTTDRDKKEARDILLESSDRLNRDIGLIDAAFIKKRESLYTTEKQSEGQNNSEQKDSSGGWSGQRDSADEAG